MTDEEPKAHTTVELPPGLKELQDKYAPQIDDAIHRLSQVNEQAKGFIRKNPGTVVLGAAVLGFLVGRWASRK